MSTEIDPKIAREMALEALRVAIAQRRDVAVGAAIYDRYDMPLSQDAFRAWHNAVAAEYDRLAATVGRQEGDVREQHEAELEAAYRKGWTDCGIYARRETDSLLDEMARDFTAAGQRKRAHIDVQIANLDRRYGHNDGSLG